jgi:hypothetical protein
MEIVYQRRFDAQVGFGGQTCHKFILEYWAQIASH